MTFDQLVNLYAIPGKHLKKKKYLQLRSFIKSLAHSLDELSMSAIERTTLSFMDIRGQLSIIYAMLRSKSKENSHLRLSAWRDNLKMNITENEWDNGCLRAQKKTINTAMRLIQYKWLVRTYVTPVKLHQYNPDIPDS